MSIAPRLIASLLVVLCSFPAFAQHRLALQGNGKLAIVDREGKIEWEMSWGPIHDIHVMENGNLLVQQGAAKVVEIDIRKQEVVWTYDAAKANPGKKVEVHSFQLLGGDVLMVAESGAQRIVLVDRQGNLTKEIKLKVDKPNPHTDTRLVRKFGKEGHYLVCHEGDGVVREYDGSGKVVWEYEVPLFGRQPKGGHGPDSFGNKCFCALRLKNGNTLISTGNGHSVLEVTPKKEVVWKVEQKDLPGITLAWVTTLEVLPNGNYLIGNCHAGKGQPQVIELEPASKKVVWTFDQFDKFGNDVSNTKALD